MPTQLPSRKDGKRAAEKDEGNPDDSARRQEYGGKRERQNQLEGEGREERNAKDHFKDLPPTLVCGIHDSYQYRATSISCPELEGLYSLI